MCTHKPNPAGGYEYSCCIPCGRATTCRPLIPKWCMCVPTLCGTNHHDGILLTNVLASAHNLPVPRVHWCKDHERAGIRM